MERRNIFTKVLAVAGTALAWAPILFMILISVVRTAQTGILRADFLIPAELFPVELAGALLLLWAALRARAYSKHIGYALLAAAVFLIGGQAVAVVSGLASGETEPTGILWTVVIASIVLYTLALVQVCIAGILLLRRLFRN